MPISVSLSRKTGAEVRRMSKPMVAKEPNSAASRPEMSDYRLPQGQLGDFALAACGPAHGQCQKERAYDSIPCRPDFFIGAEGHRRGRPEFAGQLDFVPTGLPGSHVPVHSNRSLGKAQARAHLLTASDPGRVITRWPRVYFRCNDGAALL